MPTVFKNPGLTDYFTARDDVRLGAPVADIAPITDDYEAGRVTVFPELKLDIDHDFWAALPTDAYPLLKKLSSSAEADDFTNDTLLDKKLKAVGLPPEMEAAMRLQMHSIYAQVLPIYERLFADYSFGRRQVVWRLNTIRNENLHIDTYKETFETHFARLFVNLDNQPRIWATGYTSDQLAERFSDRIGDEYREGGGREIFIGLNREAFGGGTAIWWDGQPRHMVYFDPGECWCVDSRQIAHQVIYGRRAVSFDFFVETASMKRPERHYLQLAEAYRGQALAKT